MRTYGPAVAAAVGDYRLDKTETWAAEFLRSRGWALAERALARSGPGSREAVLSCRRGARVGEGRGGSPREALLAALVDALDREAARRLAAGPAPDGAQPPP